MSKSKVLANLRRHEPSLGVALHINSPDVFEMTSQLGFDAIWLDMEHHATGLESAVNLIRAARIGGADVVVRPGKGEFMRLGRMLEAGAKGIMYPRCSSAEEAREVVQWAKFAPVGKRGCDASGPDANFMLTPLDTYLEQANEETFLIIQIEDPQALDHVDEIAAVEGVDMLMLGPGDFSILSGFPGQFDHPRLLAAHEKVIAAAENMGKRWAATCGSIAQAKEYVQRGAGLVFHGCDLVFLKQCLTKTVLEWSTADGMPTAAPNAESLKNYQEAQ
ncbi:aldolase/citrate lyase family protein [Bremerella sp. JC770]|uniref:HpcH/HpaI aldolase family protein n=1 Tax=Bremerella sp. JC770 TaxID=3232137 RepID=UPI0034577642